MKYDLNIKYLNIKRNLLHLLLGIISFSAIALHHKAVANTVCQKRKKAKDDAKWRR